MPNLYPQTTLMLAQVQTQALFKRAVVELVSGVPPRDEHALEVGTSPHFSYDWRTEELCRL